MTIYPLFLNEPIFQKGFAIAELAHLTPRQYEAYLKSVLEYSELDNVTDTAFKEGEIEKAKQIARNSLAIGLPIDTIAQITGLTLTALEIENLKGAVAK
ncbi:hypothetical protein [Methylocucumis oryzae]|uniref:hypothetical protein n=1 Tax=Methylocucumis oryzae TaxID=1632867 RepID=UPI001EFA01A0|nr:hypothetical protein [Methylocucumis oryzae]